jgi:hypothetical protein
MTKSEMYKKFKAAAGISSNMYTNYNCNETSFGWSISFTHPHHLVDVTEVATLLNRREAFADFHIVGTKTATAINFKLYPKSRFPNGQPAKQPAEFGLGTTDLLANRRHYRRLVQDIIHLESSQFGTHDAFASGDTWVVAYYSVRRVNLDSIRAKLDASKLRNHYELTTKPDNDQLNPTTIWIRLYPSAAMCSGATLAQTTPVYVPTVDTITHDNVGDYLRQSPLFGTASKAAESVPVVEIPKVAKTCGVSTKQKIDLNYDQLVAEFANKVKSGSIDKQQVTHHADTVFNLLAGDLSLNEISDVAKMIGRPVTVSIG